MGIRLLCNEIKKARGSLSQAQAARAWHVPIATLQAIEQGVDRSYQPRTLARFDKPLGRSAWDLFTAPDPAPGANGHNGDVAVPVPCRHNFDEIVERLDRVEVVVATLTIASRASSYDEIFERLSAAELHEVLSFAHGVLGRQASRDRRNHLAHGA